MPAFTLPTLVDNSDGSWGPNVTSIPKKFVDIPYAPYSKSDKIGHVADWLSADSSNVEASQAAQQQQDRRRRPREAFGAGTASFGYVHDEDEASFSLVDSGNKAPGAGRARSTGLIHRGGAGRGRGGRGGAAGRGGRPMGNLNSAFQSSSGAAAGGARGGFRGGRGGGWNAGGGRGQGGRWGEPQRLRDWSVTIGPEWQLLDEISFNRLQKLSLPVQEPEDLSIHGTIFSYDKTFETSVNTRNEKPLQVYDMLKYNPTTSDDPVIASLAEGKEAKVYTTEAILAVLMAASRSANSWDIVIVKEGDAIYLDKREGGVFDFLSVNENAADPPAESDKTDNINSASSLSLEATYINQNFACQVVNDAKRKAFKSPNPFYSADESEPLASCAYRYRRFDLSVPEDQVEGSEGPVKLIVRTEVDGYQSKKDQYITINALNEFDSKAQGAGKALDWRSKLDNQKGAVVATEMKNNSAKLARWTIQSILAGAEAMKLGFISRANPKDPQRHVIVGVQSYKPRDLAQQMNISLANGWGIVRMVIDMAMRQPEGRYVLVKDPNNPSLRFYSVPADAFETVEEDDEAEEEMEEMDEE